MKYPTLSSTKCAELAAHMVAGHRQAIDPHVEWIGQGDEPDLTTIVEVAQRITQEARDWAEKDRDRFEGLVSTLLLEALDGIPPEVLDDRGFWRYLAIRHFWDFIAWREEGPFANGNHLKYVDASTNTESVLPRMYVRARAVGGPAFAHIAAAIPNGTDFWRSHVIRVRTGSAPPVTRALATRQADDRLMTDDLRQAARRLNRTWTNVVLHLYQDDEAGDIVDSIWEDARDGAR